MKLNLFHDNEPSITVMWTKCLNLSRTFILKSYFSSKTYEMNKKPIYESLSSGRFNKPEHI